MMGIPIVTEGRRVATTTAGLRATQWNAADLPADVRLTVHPLTTSDGAGVTGYLFRRGEERTVVCAMHPREVVVATYIVPEILKGGAAVLISGPRTVGNDLRLEHETALLDLAAGQLFLRDIAGFRQLHSLGGIRRWPSRGVLLPASRFARG